MNPNIPKTVRVGFIVEGSRGDIQPYAALALRLESKGYIVKIFTNSDHVAICESLHVPVAGVLYNMAKAANERVAIDALARGSVFKYMKHIKDTKMKNYPWDTKKLWTELGNFDPTVLVTGGPSKQRCVMYSIEKTLPVIIVDLQIVIPLSDKAPFGLPRLPFGTNKVWMKLLMMIFRSERKEAKRILKEYLNVDMNGKFEQPIHDAIGFDPPSFTGPCCVGVSTIVIPVHREWPKENFYPCGVLVVDKQRQEQLMKNGSRGSSFGSKESNSDLTKFLKAGPPPIYLGWGSMLCRSPEWMVSLALEALYHSGARGIILGGWAGLNRDHIPDHLRNYCEQNVIFVSCAPHEWLFPQCACIVHHGGSGTTAASVRSGKPTIITPVFADQFDFADGVNASGCGFGLGQLTGVTGSVLGDAIKRCLEDETIISNAKKTGEKLRAEDGCENFCKIFDDWLVNGVASGVWLKKHEALMAKCRESWETQQQQKSPWKVVWWIVALAAICMTCWPRLIPCLV